MKQIISFTQNGARTSEAKTKYIATCHPFVNVFIHSFTPHARLLMDETKASQGNRQAFAVIVILVHASTNII